MKYIQNLLLSAAIVFVTVIGASAQTEADLIRYFEGMRVQVKIDMPATKDGINVYPEREQIVDFNRYGNLLKQNGIGIRQGDSTVITKLKVKDKHIEFQLGGGGFGTFGDEKYPNVVVPTASKTRREIWLEKNIDSEKDKHRRRRMREELDSLRSERERQDDYYRAEAAPAIEAAWVRIQEKRLQGGSRFNIKFDRKLTEGDLMPRAVMNALSKYVYFADLEQFGENAR